MVSLDLALRWHYIPGWPMTPALNMLTFGTFPERIAASVFLILVASPISNVAIIAAARWLLQTVESGISLSRAFKLVVLGGAAPLLLVGAPLWCPRGRHTATHEWLLIATEYYGYGNLPAAMVPLLIVALASAMLLHWLFWGVVRRPLYALGTKFHVFKIRIASWSAALGCCRSSFRAVAAAVHTSLLG